MIGSRVVVRVQARASRNAVLGDVGGKLKVAVTASPVDGKANLAVIKLLAKHFGVPPSRIQIIRGEHAREKLVQIEGDLTPS